MRTAIVTMLCVISFDGLRAEEVSTLEFYLSRSPLVIAATVTRPPLTWSSDTVHHVTDVEVNEVLHGSLEEERLRVTIEHPQRPGAPRLDAPRKGQKCILFLTQASGTPKWRTADFWFGMQAYSKQMAIAIQAASADFIEKARWEPFSRFKNGATINDLPLLTKLAKGDDKAVAIRALSQMSDLPPNETSISILQELMKSDDPEMQLQAAIMTCYCGNWSGFDHLLKCVESVDVSLRRNAVSQLGDSRFIRYKNRVVAKLLERLSEEEDHRVLERVIESLQTYPSEKVLASVKEFQNHENELIRKRASFVVHTISKRMGIEPHRSIRSRAQLRELQRSRSD